MGKGKIFQRTVSIALAAAMTLGSSLQAVAAPPGSADGRRGNLNYLSNQGELMDTPLVQLPVGAVRARGWLENQLLLQKDNLTGNMKGYNDYNEATSAWLGSSGESWERGPYYMRGLVALAYVLDDAELKEEAQAWVEAVLKSQRDNGYFGPGANDWWSRMPVLMALRDYYEATEAAGEPDERVISFMENYFRYQEKELPGRPLSNWADARGGDNIDSVYWLYNRLYDSSNPGATKWLLDLGALLESQTTDWTYQYNDTTVRQHVVNTSQGMKTPAVFYQYSGEERDKIALQNGLLNMSIDHGRVDGLPNSDEAARENRSTRGTENCGIVEGLLSTEIAQKVLGEAWIGDRIEQLAYNALPAAYTPDLSGHVYYVLQNQVMATLGNHEFGNDHGDSSAFGAPCGFDCCYSNTHMGWPKFVQNMWMATADNGLAIVAYGPNKVTAKVADGKTAVFLQETDYPFKDSVKLTYGGDTARFELKVRIPAWAAGATVTVNGVAQEGVATGDYYTIERTWAQGDVVDLEFPSEIKTSTWYNDSVAVEKGALIYGLKIEEDWRTYESNDARELKVEHQPQSPLREVYPASAWNYGLIVNPDDPASSFEVVEAEDVALQPFSSETAPVVLKAKGQLIPDWTYDGNLAGPQPYGPTAYDESLVRDIELIPYGSGRLRIAHFPKIGKATDTVVKTAALDSEMIRHNGTDYQEFANIVVPQAKSYTLKVIGSGKGAMVINNKYSQALDLSSGVAEVTDLQNKLSGGFQFTAGHYNNIRFTPSLNVESIEVIPVDRAITDVVVKSSNRNEEAIKINTNLDWQETPYKVVYGTESGNYTNTVYGFEGSTATITGIDESKDYYAKVIAFIQGEQKESEELVFLSGSSSEGGLKPNPGVPNATYAGFPTLNYMDRDWTKFDPEGKVEFVQNGDTTNIKFGVGPKVKAVLLPEDAQGSKYTLDWVDYVVEATLSVDAVDNNSCGIMFRSTNIGDGSDEFHGYFAGIGYLNVGNIDGAPYQGPGLMIGYADGGWHDIQPMKADIQPGQQYTLKVVVFGDRFAVYLNDELMTTFRDDRFGNGTVGLRSYNEAFTAYGLSVRPVEQEDLVDFEEDEVVEIHPDPDAPNAVYEGLGTQAEIKNEWTKYDPEGKIEFIDNGIVLGKGSKVKAALTLDGAQAQAASEPLLAADAEEPAEESAPVEEPAPVPEQTPAEPPAEDEAVLAPMAALMPADGEPEAQPEEQPVEDEKPVEEPAPRMLRAGSEADDPLTWTDYVVEAELSVDEVSFNNCGLMFRATGIGDDPDAYHGFFAGIGLAGDKPGVMVGYADGGWHDIKIIPKEIVAGQKYTLKVTVFGDKFAVYLNNDLQYVGDASRFPQGTVGVRSYNEAFQVYDVTVRNIEQNDLVVFGGKPDAVAEELFSENFDDAQAAAATWTKVPANANITFANGEVSLGSTTDIKLTAGDESWDNYVYEADVKIAANGNNGGLIFRTTQEGSGADNYYGYYFGLNSNGFEIGKSSNSWTQLVSKTYDVHPGSYHRLKVMAYNSNIKFYIDDVLVHSMKDGTHDAGKIGLRGYDRSFTADNVMVRTLSAEEIEEMSATAPVESMTISAAPFYNGFQVHYPKGNAATYKVQFGTEPGVYTHEFVDVKFNNYGGKMEADKVAVAVPAPGTYYVRLVGLSGTTPVSISNEVEVTTGYNEPTESDRAKMNAALADAKAADTSAYTKTSKARLDEAIAAAEALTAQADASQMDLSLATSMLKVALRVTDSEDIVFTKPVNNAALAEGSLAGTRFTGDFAGGKAPAQSTVLKAEIAGTAAGDAQLSLSASAENAAICYVVKAEAPASASEYTNLYTAPISVSVANGESIWVEVTAEDGETKLYYKVEVSTYNAIDSVAVKLFAPVADTIISETGEASVNSAAPYTHVSTGWTGATGLLLNDAPEARYEGFGSQAQTVPSWTEYDPENKVSFTADSAEGKTSIHVGTGARVKAALNVAGSSEWTDYVVEADLSVGTNDNNNAGIMLRATGIGNGPDEYNGLFVGIGYVPGSTQAQAVMIGYADGNWHDIKPIPHPIEVNRVYNLKVVAYGQNFAVYLDDEFISTFTNSTFTKGTVGVRSYNTPFDVYDLTVRPLVKDDLKVFADNGLMGEVWANGDVPVATVRLTAKDGYTFKGVEAKDILVDIGNNTGAVVSFASSQGVSADGKTLTFTATYPQVGAAIVDKTELGALIALAEEALKSPAYTQESLDALAEELAAARLVMEDDDATQDAVNDARNALEAAYQGLKLNLETELLTMSIALSKQTIEEYDLTQDSIDMLQAVIDEAEALLQDSTATQKQINDMYRKVMKTLALVVEREDRTLLSAAIDSVQSLTETQYTPTSWAALAQALDEALKVEADDYATQEAIDAAYQSLMKAMTALELRAQKAALESAVKLAQTLVESGNYSEESLSYVTELLDGAEALLADGDAAQDAVDQMAEDLTRAIAKVRLAQAVAEVNELNAARYTAASWNAVQAAQVEAKALLVNENATEEELDSAAAKLANAVKGLEKKSSSSGSVSKVSDSDYWNEIIEKINGTEKGGTVNATLESGAMMPATVIDAAAAKGVKLNIEIGGKAYLLSEYAIDASAVHYSAAELIAMADGETAAQRGAISLNPETGGEVAAAVPNAAAPAGEASSANETMSGAQQAAEQGENLSGLWLLVLAAAAIGGVSLIAVRKKHQEK